MKIGEGSVNYTGTFIHTSKLQVRDTGRESNRLSLPRTPRSALPWQQEKAAGRVLFTRVGDMSGPATLAHLAIEGLRTMAGVIDRSHGEGTANTNLIFHGGEFLALYEVDQPYLLNILDDGRIETIGRVHKGDVDSRALANAFATGCSFSDWARAFG
jgi:carotenoid cleavage dioxygenase-like enzyme